MSEITFQRNKSPVRDDETHGHVILQATKEANDAIAVPVSHELSIYLYIDISRYSKSWDINWNMNLHDCRWKELMSSA